jgi:hypothetical protein
VSDLAELLDFSRRGGLARYQEMKAGYESRIASLLTEREELRERIEELNRMKAQTWTEYEMADAQWAFTFHIHRDDGEDVLAHELAHAVQRFRWPDDEVHSDRHAAIAAALAAALDGREREELREALERHHQYEAVTGSCIVCGVLHPAVLSSGDTTDSPEDEG